MSEELNTWPELLRKAVEQYLKETVGDRLSTVHTSQTPDRVAAAYAEFVAGYTVNPADVLKTTFEDSTRSTGGMVHSWYLPIVSMCAHHIMPFTGFAHFAYVPKGRVVGLSKIPRFINILCKRLQLQENLGEEIVDTFHDAVEPHGCAVTIEAEHHCMSSRGVRIHGAVTVYTALRGSFTKGCTRLEFENARPPQRGR